MKECKYCRTKYDDNLAVCPNCGGTKIVTAEELAEEAAIKQREVEYREKANAAPEVHKKRLIGILAAMVVVVIAIIAVVSMNANKPLSNGMTKKEGEEILAAGIVYLNNGEYEAAMECFLQLPPDSKQYSEAQSLLAQSQDSYKKEIIDKVNGYISKNEYDTAFTLISKAQELLPDDFELKYTYSDVLSAYRSSILVQADEYVANNDYESAIKAVNTAIDKMGQDEELTAKLTAYQDAYRTEIIAQADSALSREGYQSAISIINQGLVVLPNDNSMLERITEYETYIPIDLFGLETFSGNPSFTVGAIIDTFGNECSQAYLKRTNNGDREFSYLLNGEYNTLSGTLMWSKDYKNDSRGWYCLMFYDGNRLLSTTAQCSAASGPIEFSTDISNVQILTVKFDGFSNQGPFEWGSVITIQK